MRPPIRGIAAIIGSALIAFSLCGSTWHPPITANPASAAEVALYNEGRRLYQAGEYTRASAAFRTAALRAERDGSPRQAAMNWTNAGGAELATLRFRDALNDLLRARRTAEAARLRVPLLFAMNNLAGVYLQMGDMEAAMRVANEALAELPAEDDGGAAPALRYQLAIALTRLHRFDEAEPIYRHAIRELSDRDDFGGLARALGTLGGDYLDAGQLDKAEDALSQALLLVRLHDLPASANILRALGKLRARQGNFRSATALFDAAIRAPQNNTPEWLIHVDRGEFRLSRNDLKGALDDFLEARRIAARMRADIVPADQDRITLESGLDRVAGGLVDAGNRLAEQNGDRTLLRETFDAAEQDHLWSLRALVPAPDDWRSHLPDTYWDLLARYQALERTLVANPSPELRKQADALQMELQQIEAAAGNEAHSKPVDAESALTHAAKVLGDDSVLLSFHVGTNRGWVWAVDRRGVDVYPIPGRDTLKAAVENFARATQHGDPQAVVLGTGLYQVLFGNVAPRYLLKKRWLLEPDGPLFDLPFGALVAGSKDAGENDTAYLFQRAVLEVVPGALMLEPKRPFGNGPFLGIGDPIYNAADPRYHGDMKRQEVALPRLPATAGELDACARTWNAASAKLLTGVNAGLSDVREALRTNPTVIHFATHVVKGQGNYSSGLIALSLDRSAALGLMGPEEIVAHTRTPSLVVLNGCHSGQGEALPGTGLMGLTRAWIGAGARSVLATSWDIPDDAGASMMVEFYRTLRNSPDQGPAYALQQAQLTFLKNRVSGNSPAIWGAYFVLGRE